MILTTDYDAPGFVTLLVHSKSALRSKAARLWAKGMDNLELTETNGYTITAVYGVGYRLDAVNTTALNRAPAQQHAAATEMLSG
jgi:hypothetical protein